MSRSVAQFVFPLSLVLFVVLAATLGVFGAALAFLALLVGLVAWRLRDVKSHPPDPELVTRPFWRFRDNRDNRKPW